jgi:hypothetical protein
MADRSLFGDKALLGVGGFRGEGPVFDDGVATWMPLIGLATEAPNGVSGQTMFEGREGSRIPSIYESYVSKSRGRIQESGTYLVKCGR